MECVYPGTAIHGPVVRRESVPATLPSRILTAAAAATFALAPIEGYLLMLHPALGKLTGALLFGAWVAVRFRLQPKPRMHGVYVLLAALASLVLASAAMHLSNPFAIVYTARWIPFLVLAAVVVDVASSQVRVRLLMASAVAGTTIAALGALFSVVVLHDPRATGPLDDPNDLAYVLVAALPLMVVFAPHGLARRLGLLAAAAAITVAAAATVSRGGMIALAAAAIWLLLRRVVPSKALVALGATVVGVGLLGSSQAGPLVSRALAEKEYIADANVDSRLIRWEAAARMLSHQPVLGGGPGSFREHYVAASRLAELGEQTPVAHSMYLEVGAELGVLGLAVFVGLIVFAFASLETALRQGAERRLVVGVQASLIAIVVASIFLSEQYYIPLWTTVAIAYAIGIRARRGDRI